MIKSALQIHPIPPLYSKESRVLILGSFPSVKSREESFFYAHPQNRFWRVIAAIFDCDVPINTQQKASLILDNGLALWDVIASCEITGSSDSSIRHVIPNNIGAIINESNIERIFVNGKTAEKYYKKYLEKAVGIKATVLPSTSPANAAVSLQELIEKWRVIR